MVVIHCYNCLTCRNNVFLKKFRRNKRNYSCGGSLSDLFSSASSALSASGDIAGVAVGTGGGGDDTKKKHFNVPVICHYVNHVSF